LWRLTWSIPRLIEVALEEAERLVNQAKQFCGGSWRVIDGAEHEILIERDSLRDQFWAAFDAFVHGGEERRGEQVR